jgi:hypothetical protein
VHAPRDDIDAPMFTATVSDIYWSGDAQAKFQLAFFAWTGNKLRFFFPGTENVVINLLIESTQVRRRLDTLWTHCLCCRVELLIFAALPANLFQRSINCDVKCKSTSSHLNTVDCDFDGGELIQDPREILLSSLPRQNSNIESNYLLAAWKCVSNIENRQTPSWRD